MLGEGLQELLVYAPVSYLIIRPNNRHPLLLKATKASQSGV
jgi:hypothetical protein